MSALITREQPMSDELYRAVVKTEAANFHVYANDCGEAGLNVCGTKRDQLVLMNLPELDALIEVLREMRNAMKGVPA